MYKSDEYYLNKKRKKIDDENFDQELDFSNLSLINDGNHRPIWVCDNNSIYFEAFSPNYKEVRDFLTSIASPISRTENIHHYKIESSSIYASISLGFNVQDIVLRLQNLSKVVLPDKVKDFIISCGSRFGKVKLLLKRVGYFIESEERTVLEILLGDEIIKESINSDIASREEVIEFNEVHFNTEIEEEDIRNEIELNTDSPKNMVVDEIPTQKRIIYSVQVGSEIETLKKRCVELGYPLLEEFDYLGYNGQEISISLKQQTKLRKYQQQCLSKIFSNGRMKSGIISLACGAGKSLIGVATCSTLKKRTIVLCTSTVSVEQWRHQFKLWSNIHHSEIVTFTSNTKTKIATSSDLGSILITTYSMIANSHKRSGYSYKVIKLIEKEVWGLVILDEVHVVPASTFRILTSKIKSHCKLGLSATLVREDNMIDHLIYLIGPKLYEANWMDLIKSGHIANALCTEVTCEMTEEFFKQYLSSDTKIKKALFNSNPNKLRACEYLIRYHEQRNDKILVFSDDIFTLKVYSRILKIPYIYGGTSNNERIKLFNQFQYDTNMKTLLISKIGDYSINLPEANVLIQISSHYGSRRQEAQRLGRILRPKNRFINYGNSHDAFFYTLVSKDTKELYYARKRRQFLIEQGYAFNVADDYHKRENIKSMSTLEEQKELLNEILNSDTQKLEESENLENMVDIDVLDDIIEANIENNLVRPIEYTYTRRELSSITGFSGGDELRYIEIEEN